MGVDAKLNGMNSYLPFQELESSYQESTLTYAKPGNNLRRSLYTTLAFLVLNACSSTHQYLDVKEKFVSTNPGPKQVQEQSVSIGDFNSPAGKVYRIILCDEKELYNVAKEVAPQLADKFYKEACENSSLSGVSEVVGELSPNLIREGRWAIRENGALVPYVTNDDNKDKKLSPQLEEIIKGLQAKLNSEGSKESPPYNGWANVEKIGNGYRIVVQEPTTYIPDGHGRKVERDERLSPEAKAIMIIVVGGGAGAAGALIGGGAGAAIIGGAGGGGF